MSKKLITAYISSAIIAILLIIKVDDIPFVYNSLINKYIVCSIFIVSLVLSIIGSYKARLIWLGFLPFFAYSYFICYFRTIINLYSYSLLYPLISLLSIIALICSYLSIDIQKIKIKKASQTPFKLFVTFIILLITMFILLRYHVKLNEVSDLFLLPLDMLLFFSLKGRFLLIIFLIMYIIAIILLRMNEPWGYVLSTIILISHAIPSITFILAIITGGSSALIYGPYTVGEIGSVPETTYFLFFKGLPSFFALILAIIFISYFKEDIFGILTKKLKIIRGKIN